MDLLDRAVNRGYQGLKVNRVHLELKVNRGQPGLKVNLVCLALKVSRVNEENLDLGVNQAHLGLKVKRASKVSRAGLDLKEKLELHHQVISD